MKYGYPGDIIDILTLYREPSSPYKESHPHLIQRATLCKLHDQENTRLQTDAIQSYNIRVAHPTQLRVNSCFQSDVVVVYKCKTIKDILLRYSKFNQKIFHLHIFYITSKIQHRFIKPFPDPFKTVGDPKNCDFTLIFSR